MKPKIPIETLFDLAAPIAIYHRRDVCFKSQANAAWSKIKKIDLSAWKRFGCVPPPDLTIRMDALGGWAKDTYDKLFWGIVEGRYPCWTWVYDKGGAKEVRDGIGRRVFSGDSNYDFPWYETAELLVSRLDEHYNDCRMNNESTKVLC